VSDTSSRTLAEDATAGPSHEPNGSTRLSPLKVCLTKQRSTYDLYARTGPDLRTIVESSNWRSGPIGLWEAYDCEMRIVHDSTAPECQFGKNLWAQYVKDWDLFPEDCSTEAAEDVDWSAYDVVISLDIAVPTAVVKRHPDVLWCCTFIEVHTTGKYDRRVIGHPRFGYNVLLNHHLPHDLLDPSAPALRSMRRERRAILDYPYYVQSAHSVQLLYPELAASPRTGICLTHHSRQVLTEPQRQALARFGPLQIDYVTCADLLQALAVSKYLIYHPDTDARAGNAVIEAISAGALVLVPGTKLWGYPELLADAPAFTDFDGLVDVLTRLESQPELYDQERARQAQRVQEWCYENPVRNLDRLTAAFREATVSSRTQALAEARDLAAGYVVLAGGAAGRRGRKLVQRLGR
jgi:hypothetical protein